MINHLLQWERGFQTEMAAYESTYLRRKQAPLGNLYPQNCSCKDGRASIWLPKPFSWHHRSYKRWCEIFMHLSCHISKEGVCIQRPNAQEQFGFVLIEKRFFALTESHQQKYHITEEMSLKCPWQVDGLTKAEGKKMPLSRRQAIMGTGEAVG